MRMLTTAVAGIAAFAVLSSAASSGSARGPSQHHARTADARTHHFATPSCNAAASGPQAWDTTYGFATNEGTAYVFGNTLLATGGYSGTLEGTQNYVCDYNSVIMDGYGNEIDSRTGNTPAGAAYSFIGAGQGNIETSQWDFIGAGEDNTIESQESGIGAGTNNSTGGQLSFVGAGNKNETSGADTAVLAGDTNVVAKNDSFVGAGFTNVVSASDSVDFAGERATVSGAGSLIGAGGTSLGGNTVSGLDAAVGAGDENSNAGSEAFIGSGGSNSIASGAAYATILGGNRDATSGEYASVLGGFGNKAAGTYSIVAGGDQDSGTGILTFVAGYHANAAHDGSFVWSDYVSGSSTIADAAANTFVVRASGGTQFYSNEAATAGVKLGPGSGAWASLSDRNAKTGFVSMDGASVLENVARVPVARWQYVTEPGVRHIGPMAQDFFAAFGTGEDDRHITAIDESGVDLAAIGALQRELGDLRRGNARLKARFSAQLAAIREKNESLKTKFATLERKLENDGR